MGITTSLSPNTQPDDVTLAFKILCRPWRWRDTNINAQVTQKISQQLDGRKVVMTSSGRSAIYHALRALSIGPGDEVVIQAFTCLAVSAPVQWTGAQPIYADINPSTYNFDLTDLTKKITPRTKAIIVQHTFGIAGPIKELQTIAKQHQLTLIEDLAHSFGSTYHNRPLGTFGDLAVLSFGRDKTISCVFGGAIAGTDQALINKIRRYQQQLPQPPYWWVKQQLLHPLLMAIVVPLYFTFSLGKIILVLSQKMKFLSMAVTSSEKKGLQPPFINWQFSPALGFLLDRQLTKLNQFTTRRRSIARRYQEALPIAQQLTITNQPNWIRFPVKVKNRVLVVNQAKQQHILLGRWYDQPVTPSATTQSNPTQYKTGSCPQAEQAAQHTINLPTHPRLTDKQVNQLIKFMKSVQLI